MRSIVITVLVSALTISGAALAQNASPSAMSAGSSATGDGLSTTCQFTKGPKTGQVQHWPRGTPGVTPVAIGQGCTDDMKSYGVAIADSANASMKSSGGTLEPNDGYSTTCRFDSGPRAGQVQHWPRGTPGLALAAIGQGCTDGQNSSGIAIADDETGTP